MILKKSNSKDLNNDVSIKTLFCYGMGSLGNNIIYAMISSYFLIFLTDSFGIGAAAIGTLFLIARIIDSITDPIMGVIVDNTNTKMGKSRPYLLIVPIFMGIATVMCFSAPNLSYNGKIIWLYASYILWGICFTAMDIPYWSLSANITRDPESKTKIITTARTIAYGGGFIVSIFTIPLVAKTGNWRLVATIYSILGVLLTWITVFGVKEINNYEQKKLKSEKQGIKQFIKLIKTNKPLRILLITMLILEFSGALKNGVSIYYIKYNFNAEMFIPITGSLGIAASIVGGILLPYLTKILGKRNTALMAISVSVAGSFTLFILSYSSLLGLILLNTIMGVLDGASYISLQSMLADCVEYGEWKTGKRSEGMIFSANIFKSKLAGAIGGSLCGYILSYIGYKANTTQSHFTLNGIHLLSSLVPFIAGIITFLILRKYNLTEKEYAAIVEDLRNGDTLVN